MSLIRQVFLKALDEQSRNMINYYDFLLVAKKLNFRFEESAHLMELRKHFFSHKNQILNKKLAALLCVDEDTLRETVADTLPDKMYRFSHAASYASGSAPRKSSPSSRSPTRMRKVRVC